MFNITHTKRGGMHFVRVGHFVFSFCYSTKQPRRKVTRARALGLLAVERALA